MRKLRKGDSYGFLSSEKVRKLSSEKYYSFQTENPLFSGNEIPTGRNAEIRKSKRILYTYKPTDPRLIALPLALIYLLGYILWSMLKHVLSRPYSRLSLTILISIFCCCAANGQEGSPKASLPQAVLIGDRLTEEFWNREHLIYDKQDTLRKSLSEYRDKVIIFDFWASWCAACFHTMPKMQALQDEFGDKLQVILVNPLAYDKDYHKLSNSYQKFQEKSGVALPSIVLDEYLFSCFPQRGVPRYVWLNADGLCVAVTRNSFVDGEQIMKVISGKF